MTDVDAAPQIANIWLAPAEDSSESVRRIYRILHDLLKELSSDIPGLLDRPEGCSPRHIRTDFERALFSEKYQGLSADERATLLTTVSDCLARLHEDEQPTTAVPIWAPDNNFPARPWEAREAVES